MTKLTTHEEFRSKMELLKKIISGDSFGCYFCTFSNNHKGTLCWVTRPFLFFHACSVGTER